MFFAFFFFAICFETFSFCHTPRLHPNPKFVQNSVVANASRTMVPPVWPAEDEVKPIVKQQPKKSNSASAVIEATAANEGAVKSDDGSGSREIVLQQSEPSVPEASDMDAGSPKEMSVKKWVKAFAAAAAAAAAEDESEGDSGALGRYRDISEKRHYEWLATEEGRSFSARLAAAADRDTTSVLGYVHWTFPDQSVEDQYPSYIMARSLDDIVVGLATTDTEMSSESATAADVAESSSSSGSARDSAGASSRAIKLHHDTEQTLLEGGLHSPELAAGYPRGVTPRGNTFVAKIGSSDGYDYLGSFRSPAEASMIYGETAAAYEAARSRAANGDRKPSPAEKKPPSSKSTSKKGKKSGGSKKAASKNAAQESEASSSSATAQASTAVDTTVDAVKGPPKQLHPPRPSPPPVTPLFADRDRWLVTEAIPVQPQRMADVRSAQGAKMEEDDDIENDRDGKEAVASGTSKKKAKVEKRPSLYNRVVTVDKQPPCYPYKYVLSRGASVLEFIPVNR
jgi:hypothetical protein